jgi:hypothetical protein
MRVTAHGADQCIGQKCTPIRVGPAPVAHVRIIPERRAQRPHIGTIAIALIAVRAQA